MALPLKNKKNVFQWLLLSDYIFNVRRVQKMAILSLLVKLLHADTLVAREPGHLFCQLVLPLLHIALCAGRKTPKRW